MAPTQVPGAVERWPVSSFRAQALGILSPFSVGNEKNAFLQKHSRIYSWKWYRKTIVRTGNNCKDLKESWDCAIIKVKGDEISNKDKRNCMHLNWMWKFEEPWCFNKEDSVITTENIFGDFLYFLKAYFIQRTVLKKNFNFLLRQDVTMQFRLVLSLLCSPVFKNDF